MSLPHGLPKTASFPDLSSESGRQSEGVVGPWFPHHLLNKGSRIKGAATLRVTHPLPLPTSKSAVHVQPEGTATTVVSPVETSTTRGQSL